MSIGLLINCLPSQPDTQCRLQLFRNRSHRNVSEKEWINKNNPFSCILHLHRLDWIELDHEMIVVSSNICSISLGKARRMHTTFYSTFHIPILFHFVLVIILRVFAMNRLISSVHLCSFSLYLACYIIRASLARAEKVEIANASAQCAQCTNIERDLKTFFILYHMRLLLFPTAYSLY